MADEKEKQNQILVRKALQGYVAKERKEIKKLNHIVSKMVKESDVYFKEKEDSSLQVYEQAVKVAEEYFAENKDSATALCKEMISQLDKTCHALLEGLNRESHSIDPFDAENEADHLAQDYSDEIRQRNRWRRRVIKDNYNELKEQEAVVQKALNADEVAKATMVIISANLVI